MITVINDRARDKEIAEWIMEKVNVFYTPGNPCFATEKDGRLIGAAMLSDWNGSNVCIHQRMDSPAAITRNLLYVVFDFVFNVIKARRLTGAVVGNNPKAMALNLHLGFRFEGVYPDYFPGEDGTVTHFVMFKHECRFLEERYAA